MSNNSITSVNPNDKNYQEIAKTAAPKSRINYKHLAKEISNGPAGTIIIVKYLRGEAFDKNSLSNIKRCLNARKIIFDKHYTISFKAVEGQGAYYITIKG